MGELFLTGNLRNVPHNVTGKVEFQIAKGIFTGSDINGKRALPSSFPCSLNFGKDTAELLMRSFPTSFPPKWQHKLNGGPIEIKITFS